MVGTSSRRVAGTWLAVALAALLPGAAVGSETTMVRHMGRADGSYPTHLVRIGRLSYFVASDPRHGPALWRTDGTRAGTRLVRGSIDTEPRSYPSDLTRVGDALYLLVNGERRAPDLWRNDGTWAGTHRMLDHLRGRELWRHRQG